MDEIAKLISQNKPKLNLYTVASYKDRLSSRTLPPVLIKDKPTEEKWTALNPPFSQADLEIPSYRIKVQANQQVILQVSWV